MEDVVRREGTLTSTNPEDKKKTTISSRIEQSSSVGAAFVSFLCRGISEENCIKCAPH